MMLGLGWTYLKIGKKSDARAHFRQVLVLDRGNLRARAGLEAL